MSTTREILEKAADLIESGSHLAKGIYIEPASEGDFGNFCYCAIGAIQKAATGDACLSGLGPDTPGPDTSDVDTAVAQLVTVLPPKQPDVRDSFRNARALRRNQVFLWNDSDTTQAEVVAKLREAAAACQP